MRRMAWHDASHSIHIPLDGEGRKVMFDFSNAYAMRPSTLFNTYPITSPLISRGRLQNAHTHTIPTYTHTYLPLAHFRSILHMRG